MTKVPVPVLIHVLIPYSFPPEKKISKQSKMLISASRNSLRLVARRTNQVRYSSGIKLLNERAKAEEDYYFSKQDGM